MDRRISEIREIVDNSGQFKNDTDKAMLISANNAVLEHFFKGGKIVFLKPKENKVFMNNQDSYIDGLYICNGSMRYELDYCCIA